VRLAIDTNAYRSMMAADAEAVRLVRSAERLFLPVPVLAELRFGFLNGTRGRENEATLQSVQSTVEMRATSTESSMGDGACL
jgi:predicted nucleic acid-binding protein